MRKYLSKWGSSEMNHIKAKQSVRVTSGSIIQSQSNDMGAIFKKETRVGNGFLKWKYLYPWATKSRGRDFFKGGRFVTPWILPFLLFWFVSSFASWFGFEAILWTWNLSIFSFLAQVALDSKTFPCHPIDPSHPSPIFFKPCIPFPIRGIFPLFEDCEATPIYIAP